MVEKLEVVKLKKYNEGLTLEEEDKLLKKEGCRRLTADEFLENYESKAFDAFLPCRLQDGFSARRYGGYYLRRDVGLDRRPSGRLGVLGVRIKKKVKEVKE